MAGVCIIKVYESEQINWVYIHQTYAYYMRIIFYYSTNGRQWELWNEAFTIKYAQFSLQMEVFRELIEADWRKYAKPN